MSALWSCKTIIFALYDKKMDCNIDYFDQSGNDWTDKDSDLVD